MNVLRVLMLTAAVCGTLSASAAKPAKPAPVAQPTPAPAAAPDVSSGGGQRRSVELTPERLAKPIGIRGAPNVATMLSFPEAWAAPPSCGDCVVGDQANGKPNTLWRIDIYSETNTIAVKPIAFPGPDLPLTAFEASLDVTLAGGTAVTIFLTLAEVPANADLRVDFRLPGGADAKSRRTALERELIRDYDARVAEAVKDALAETMMSNTRCKDYAGGPRQRDGLVVRVKQICRNSAYIYAVFEVENGGAADLALAQAELSDKSVASDFYRFKSSSLLFRARTLGFAALQSIDPNAPTGLYSLTVKEDGGAERSLVIDGIQF